LKKQVNNDLKKIDIINETTEEINGFKAIEVELFTNLDDQKTLIYYMIIVNDNQGLLVQGIAKTDFENNTIEFKKLTHTVKFK
ncbi:MAG: hypothetical protein V2A54_06030, partial [Bacteroidota bacterium]